MSWCPVQPIPIRCVVGRSAGSFLEQRFRETGLPTNDPQLLLRVKSALLPLARRGTQQSDAELFLSPKRLHPVELDPVHTATAVSDNVLVRPFVALTCQLLPVFDELVTTSPWAAV